MKKTRKRKRVTKSNESIENNDVEKMEYLNIKDINFVYSKQNWDRSFNVKKNKDLRKYIFGENSTCDVDIYGFYNLEEVGIALKGNEQTIVFAYEKPNGGRAFCITEMNNIYSLIKSGKNHWHELISNNFCKGFIDIECEIDAEKYFNIKRKNVIKALKALCGYYDEFIGKLVGFDFKNLGMKNYLLMESSKKKKVSFHIIFNHIFNGVPIYYKNITHWIHVLKRIVLLPNISKTMNGFSIDPNFYQNKSIRTLFSSHFDEPERIFYPLNEKFEKIVKIENENLLFESSIIQINKKVADKNNKIVLITNQSIGIEMENNSKKVIDVDNENNVDEKNNKKRKVDNNTMFTMFKGSTGQKKILDGEALSLCDKIKSNIILMLINVKNLAIFKKKFDFSHLNNPQIVYTMYRSYYQPEKRLIYIELYGKHCLLNKYEHNQKAGRTIRIDPENMTMSIMCKGCEGTQRNNFLNLSITSKLAARFNITQDVVKLWSLIKKK